LTLYAAAGNSHYTLFDAAGNQLRAGNISGGKVEMDISNLAPGVYFLYLNGGERLRFVKQ
ncbi:MAG TPA: T9SS type A sorting domain-containing protein, partial [Flavisolibacter sp.]|nr:T9SS type A sorting domain-containing protein [Flavisolibacter sp.]